MLLRQRNKTNPWGEVWEAGLHRILSGVGLSVSSVYSPAGKRGGFHSAIQSPKVPCSSLGNTLSTQLVFLVPTGKSARKKGEMNRSFFAHLYPLVLKTTLPAPQEASASLSWNLQLLHSLLSCRPGWMAQQRTWPHCPSSPPMSTCRTVLLDSACSTEFTIASPVAFSAHLPILSISKSRKEKKMH